MATNGWMQEVDDKIREVRKDIEDSINNLLEKLDSFVYESSTELSRNKILDLIDTSINNLDLLKEVIG